MALINCPQCNHTVSDKTKKCINCGYEFKKKQISKKKIIILISGFCALVVLLFAVTLITSQVGVKQYFNLIADKNFSCVFGNHHWKSATCYKPKFCSICNSEKGEPLEHKWKEADCINPKTCLQCKQTEGSPLEHTVNIGICNRCIKYVNKYEIEFTVIDESLACLEKSFDNIANYFNVSSSSALRELYYCNLAKTEALNIKKAACIARDICGDIPEFAEVKKCFEKINTTLSDEIDIELTVNNYVSYANNTLSPKVADSAKAFNETVDEVNKIIEG